MKDKRQEYFNNTAEEWRNRGFREDDSAKLNWLLSFNTLKPGDKMLDAGCGAGRFSVFINQKFDANINITGVDFAENMVEIARQILPTARFIKSDVSSMPFKNQEFDVVFCFQAWPHFANKPKAIREFHRVLKNNGKLVIAHIASRTRINEIHASIGFHEDILEPAPDIASMVEKEAFTVRVIEELPDRSLVIAEKS